MSQPTAADGSVPPKQPQTAGAKSRRRPPDTRRFGGAFAWMLGRRLVMMAVLLLAISFGVFLLQYLSPGGVVRAITGGRPVSPEVLAALTERYRLDEPFYVQYFTWLSHAVQGDLGMSYRNNQDVTGLIIERGALSLQLALLAFGIALAVGLPMAMVAALRQRSTLDRVISGSAALAVAAPPFVVGVFLLYLFGVQLGWLPVFGAGEGFVGRLQHLVLPAIALTIGVIALVIKVSRAAMIQALNEEYVTFARSRGLRTGRIIRTYVLRNGLAPIITAAGLTFTILISSTVLVEQIFALPGLGSLLIDSVTNQDVPVVQGVSLAIGAIILLVNLLADVAYSLTDPRVDMAGSLS